MNNFNNGDYLSDRFDGNILVPRKEVLNPDRFKRHIITVFDEYMPHISGLSLMRDVALKGFDTNKIQFFILLTMSRESDWDKYLLKANAFKDDASESKNEQLYSGTYYYAFTNQFHEHGIDTSKILSYEAFLNQQKKNLY